MMSLYPTRFQDIASWAREQDIPPSQARERFAQYGVLQAIANSQALSDLLVFKGGNALDFVWMPNRSTRDLDFSAREAAGMSEERLERLFNGALDTVTNDLGTLYRVQRIRQNPPGPERTFITYAISIGYALSDDQRNRRNMQAKRPSPATIQVEVSLNEPICGSELTDFEGTHRVSVATREDIVAEKLRALLQQIPRNRQRPQDLLDISVMLREKIPLDLDLVAAFLLRKSEARSILAGKLAFQIPEVWDRARGGYANLQETSRGLFIPFDEAREALLELISRLDIPE